MKYFYILLAFIPINLFGQTIIDSVYTVHCNTHTSMGEDFYDTHVDSVISTYGVGGELLTRITILTNYRDNVITYTDSSMDSLAYDAGNNSITTYSGIYQNSALYITSARIVVYDIVTGNKTSEAYAPSFPNFTQFFSYTYLPNNLIDSFVRFLIGSATNDSTLFDYTYDASWNRISEESFKMEGGVIARPYDRKQQYFNGSNQIVAYDWDQWLDSIVGFDDCYNDTAWFSYNVAGQLIEENHHYCPSNNGFITIWYSYDAFGVLDSTGLITIDINNDTTTQVCDAGASMIVDDVKSISDNKQFSLYPNPSAGKVIVSGNFSDMKNELRVCDLSGRVIMTKNILVRNNNSIEADLSELSSGIYVLQIFDNGLYSILFMKE